MKSIKIGANIIFNMAEGKRTILKITDFLASGGEAETYIACNILEPTDRYCVKYICGAFQLQPEAMHKKLTVLAKNSNILPEAFVMPLAVSPVFPGNGICYAMPLLEGYQQLSPIMIKPDNYSLTMKTEIICAVARAFQSLQQIGYHYGDVSDSNILYRYVGSKPVVRIIDAEGICPEGYRLSLAEGTGRYRAPEVIGGAAPSIQSDIHAFSVLAFRMFMNRHPLETKTVREATPDHVSFKRFYCTHPRFIFDPDVREPLPAGVIRRWKELPSGMREYFSEVFSQKALLGKKERPDYARFLALANKK